MDRKLKEIISNFSLNKIVDEIGYQLKQSIIDEKSELHEQSDFNVMAIYEYCAKLAILLEKDYNFMKDSGFKVRYQDPLFYEIMKSIGYSIENGVCWIQSQPKPEDLEKVIKTHLWHKINMNGYEISPFSNKDDFNYNNSSSSKGSSNSNQIFTQKSNDFYVEKTNDKTSTEINSDNTDNNNNEVNINIDNKDNKDDQDNLDILALLDPPVDDSDSSSDQQMQDENSNNQPVKIDDYQCEQIKTHENIDEPINSQDYMSDELSFLPYKLSDNSVNIYQPREEKTCPNVSNTDNPEASIGSTIHNSDSTSFERIKQSEIDEIAPLVNLNPPTKLSNNIITSIYPDLTAFKPEDPYFMPWICEQCNFQNNGGYKCVQCDIVNLDRKKQLSHQNKKEIQSIDQVIYENDKSWTCRSCSYKNVHGFRCVSCNKYDKKVRERHDSDNNMDVSIWQCRKCKTTNNNVNECTYCQSTLCNTEIYFCRTCSFINGLSCINCEVCNSTNKTNKDIVKCSQCDERYVNSKYHEICRLCLIKKHGKWICSNCKEQFENSNSEMFCRICGNSKV